MTDTRTQAGSQPTSMVMGAVAVFVALVGGLLITLNFTGGDDDSAAADQSSDVQNVALTGGELFLEPAQSIGTDAFFVGTQEMVDIVPVYLPTSPDQQKEDPAPAGTATVDSVSGTEPGLYGGTKDNSRCNRLRQVEFLEANQDKATAWSAIHGIQPSEVRSFVNTLTPVVLLKDTRVTNHGFRDGRANPLQSVLQAGTAVLVDEQGLPRVRCSCGNPLAKPIPQTTVVYAGEQWSGFSQEGVQVVSASNATTQQLVLQDLEGGDLFARPVGTTGGADLLAPPEVLQLVRTELLVPDLGNPSVSQPVGGAVVMGTAALTADLESVNTLTPIDDIADNTLINVFTPEGFEIVDVKPQIIPSDEAVIAAEPERAIPLVERVDQATPDNAAAPDTAAPAEAVAPTTAPDAAEPAQATPVPPPAATAVPATPVPPTPTAVPPTAVPATPTPPPPTPTEVPPTPTPEPTVAQTEVVLTGQGSVSANSTFTGFPASAAVDGDVGSSWFSTGPGVGPAVFTWSGPRTELTQISFIGNASNSNPEFQSGFGFSSVTVEVLDGGNVVYSSSGGGEGWQWLPNVTGNQVRLTFSGHQSQDCGGFSELIIKGLQ